MAIIRAATEADLPQILEILNEATANTAAVWSVASAMLDARRTWLLDQQGRGFPILVADEGGAVPGYASYGAFRP